MTASVLALRDDAAAGLRRPGAALGAGLRARGSAAGPGAGSPALGRRPLQRHRPGLVTAALNDALRGAGSR